MIICAWCKKSFEPKNNKKYCCTSCAEEKGKQVRREKNKQKPKKEYHIECAYCHKPLTTHTKRQIYHKPCREKAQRDELQKKSKEKTEFYRNIKKKLNMDYGSGSQVHIYKVAE